MRKLLEVLKLVMGRKAGCGETGFSVNDFLPLEAKPGRVFAVDGGNATIYDGGAWILSKIRTSVVGYEDKKRVFENRIAFELHCLVEHGSVKFDKEVEFPAIDFSSSRFEEIPSGVRAIVEKLTAINLLKEMKRGDVLLLDAMLCAEVLGEETILKRLFDAALEHEVSLIGIAKTSRLHTPSGRSLLGYLNEIGPDSAWKYKLGKGKVPYKDVVAKFHPKSDYCYRCHVVGDCLGVAAYHSRDPELIGYPYPLLRADKLARISNHEKEAERRGVRVLARRMGIKGFEYDIRSQDFHKKLDKRMYR
jgi:hypothetical protein